MVFRARARYLAEDGRFLHGIPARDLTESDWQQLTEAQRALVEAADFFEIAQPVKELPVKELPGKKRAGGNK